MAQKYTNICETALLLGKLDVQNSKRKNESDKLIAYVDEVDSKTGEVNTLTVLF